MRTLLATVVLASIALASPSMAKSKSGSNDDVVLTQDVNGKFCTAPVIITGSLLPYRVCKTRAEWLANGAREIKR